MLQWMGGSRRKVAAAKALQQQHQFTVGSESCANDRKDINQQPREHQSLDILNPVNLSTPTPVCKPSCQKGGAEDLDANFYGLKDNNISGVSKVSKIRIYESSDDEGRLLNHKAEPSSSKRTSATLPENHPNDIQKATTTTDLMDGTEQKLSVFDLVDDDDDDHTTTYLEECSPSEPHMAFSVEGLGKMNTETPPNSPQPSGRIQCLKVAKCSKMTAVIGLPLASLLKTWGERKEALSVITCANHISANQEATSATRQILTTTGSLMKMSGTLTTYANG